MLEFPARQYSQIVSLVAVNFFELSDLRCPLPTQMILVYTRRPMPVVPNGKVTFQ